MGLVVGLVGLAGLAGLETACAGALRERPGDGVGVPHALEGDVTAGYRTYAATLERWGRWSADPLYAVRWCPSAVDPATFVPYRSAGHWVASVASETDGTTAWGAAPGSPSWQSDDRESWGDITMHHGWWVHLDEGAPRGAWCWIPGAAQTAGRVVWRSADGFVGWAPEPPSAADVSGAGDGADAEDDAVAVDDLAWSYELLGTLFDTFLDPALLADDAAAVAEAATHRARRDPQHPGALRRIGPGRDQVTAARKALASYVLAHPSVGSDGHAQASGVRATATPTVTVTSRREPPPSGSTGASASSEGAPSGPVKVASASNSGPSALPLAAFAAAKSRPETEDALPPSMVIYEQILHDPVLVSGYAGSGFVPGGIAPSPYLPLLSPGLRTAARAGGNAVAGYGTSARTSGSAAPASHPSSSSASHGSGHSSSASSSSSSSTKSHGK